MPRVVIAYDIRDPKRLRRVHRAAQRLATPFQYSVFIADWPEGCDLAERLAPLAALIDPRVDDLRAYPLPARGLICRLGRATLPAGIHFTGLPAPLHEDLFEGAGDHASPDLPEAP